MKIHEYQGKEILRQFGVPVPRGIPAFTVQEAVEAAQKLGGPVWVVKAQIHAGGRGKGGGVKLAESLAEVITRMVEAANEIHDRHNGSRVLLASHGLAVAALYLTVKQSSFHNIYKHIPENGQPLVINVDSKIELPDFRQYPA